MKWSRRAAFALIGVIFALHWTAARAATPEQRLEPELSREEAQAAFDRFRGLAGTWNGKSTKGWEERTSYRVIAGESVVMGTSFDAHPGETMITMVHLDGDRLMLTHYCVARNQPRLVATSVDEEGGEILFEFLDATGMSSRDQGHMDKVIWRFEGPDRFTSQWTWYQDGEESWMEEIVHEREGGS